MNSVHPAAGYSAAGKSQTQEQQKGQKMETKDHFDSQSRCLRYLKSFDIICLFSGPKT